MAGQRQPLNLILLKGKKHLTKEEIENRKNQEVDAPSDKITPPDYLSTKKLKEEFVRIAEELQRVELISNLDVDALARFLLAQEQYVKLTKLLRNTEPIMTVQNEETGKEYSFSNEVYTDLLTSQDKLFKQCRQSASDLGLTISSRCRLVVPKQEKPQPTEFDKRFGDV